MILDIVLGIIIILFFIWGLAKGIVRNIFGLLGVIAGILLASRYAPNFIIAHSKWEFAKELSFIVLFIIVFLVIYLIGQLIYKLLSTMKISFIDHLMGGVLGIVKGCIIVWIICFIVLVFPNGNEKIKASKISTFILTEMRFLNSYLPESWQDNLDVDKPRAITNILDVQEKTVTEPPKRARDASKSISKHQRAIDSAYQQAK